MPRISNSSRLNPRECEVFRIFCDQSLHVKSKKVIYVIKHNKKTTVKFYVVCISIMYNFSQMTGVELSSGEEELTNLVSKETITQMRNEVRMEQKKGRVLQDESVKARADAEQLQREEERLGALADVLENEVVSREWQVPRRSIRVIKEGFLKYETRKMSMPLLPFARKKKQVKKEDWLRMRNVRRNGLNGRLIQL